jgi:hypothetical protein
MEKSLSFYFFKNRLTEKGGGGIGPPYKSISYKSTDKILLQIIRLKDMEKSLNPKCSTKLIGTQ